MIDLHIHILPGLDDGPQSMPESLDMARQAAAGGIEAVAATPHVAPGLYDNNRESILRALRHFRTQLHAHGISLAVHPGAEYLLDPELPALIRAGGVLTLGDEGRFLLVEFPVAEIPLFAEQTFFEIALLGVTPVLAHPERNGELLRNPGRLFPFLERGVLCQGTAGSFTGRFGARVRQLAHHYLREGCYQFIASDAHGPVNRKPGLAAARDAIAGYSEETASLLTAVNPRRLLRGQAPVRPPAANGKAGPRGKSFWGGWSGWWGKIKSRK